MMVVVIVAFTIGCTTAKAAIECPPYYNGDKLAVVEVTEGPPSEKWSLYPEDGGWNIDYIPKSGRMFYIVCEYNKTKK